VSLGGATSPFRDVGRGTKLALLSGSRVTNINGLARLGLVRDAVISGSMYSEKYSIVEIGSKLVGVASARATVKPNTTRDDVDRHRSCHVSQEMTDEREEPHRSGVVRFR